MGDVDFEISEDNTQEVIKDVRKKMDKALTKIASKVEKYAKALCPVGTVESTGKKGYRGGTLRNSIEAKVENGDTLIAGSNVEYAPYVELGTGPYFEPPPDWEDFSSSKGSGVGHGYVHARPFLRPAIEDHLSEFDGIIEDELRS